jgi:hypothetical protein
MHMYMDTSNNMEFMHLYVSDRSVSLSTDL